jgi:hypothetical protein
MTPTQDDPSTKYEPYPTSDTPYAAFLLFSGLKMAGTVQDPNDFKREVCVFVYEDRVIELERDWRLGRGVASDFKKYHRSLKTVNRAVNENRKKREED